MDFVNMFVSQMQFNGQTLIKQFSYLSKRFVFCHPVFDPAHEIRDYFRVLVTETTV